MLPRHYFAAKGQAQIRAARAEGTHRHAHHRNRHGMHGTAVDELLIDDDKMPVGQRAIHRSGKASHSPPPMAPTPGKNRSNSKTAKNEPWFVSTVPRPGPPPNPLRTASFIVGGAGPRARRRGGVIGNHRARRRQKLWTAMPDPKRVLRPPINPVSFPPHQGAAQRSVHRGRCRALGVSGFLFWRSTARRKRARAFASRSPETAPSSGTLLVQKY